MFNMREAPLSQQDRRQDLGPPATADRVTMGSGCGVAGTVMGQRSAGTAPKGRTEGYNVTAVVRVGVVWGLRT